MTPPTRTSAPPTPKATPSSPPHLAASPSTPQPESLRDAYTGFATGLPLVGENISSRPTGAPTEGVYKSRSDRPARSGESEKIKFKNVPKHHVCHAKHHKATT